MTREESTDRSRQITHYLFPGRLEYAPYDSEALFRFHSALQMLMTSIITSFLAGGAAQYLRIPTLDYPGIPEEVEQEALQSGADPGVVRILDFFEIIEQAVFELAPIAIAAILVAVCGLLALVTLLFACLEFVETVNILRGERDVA